MVQCGGRRSRPVPHLAVIGQRHRGNRLLLSRRFGVVITRMVVITGMVVTTKHVEDAGVGEPTLFRLG